MICEQYLPFALPNEDLDVFGNQCRLLVNDAMPTVWNSDQLAARNPTLKPIEAVGKRKPFPLADNQ
jgi:hypothetical protein